MANDASSILKARRCNCSIQCRYVTSLKQSKAAIALELGSQDNGSEHVEIFVNTLASPSTGMGTQFAESSTWTELRSVVQYVVWYAFRVKRCGN